MATKFNIPRQSDKEMVTALVETSAKLQAIHRFRVQVEVPHLGGVKVTEGQNNPELGKVLSLDGPLANRFILLSEGGHRALVVTRNLERPCDVAEIVDDWAQNFPAGNNQKLFFIHANLLNEARKHLKAGVIDAALMDDGSHAWSKYRTAQTTVLASLQRTSEQVIAEVAEKNAEAERRRTERFEELENKLRSELAAEREKLLAEHEAKSLALQVKIIAHEQREAEYETKEARYVARKKQEEQVEQVRNWLSDWKLTQGTTEKRRPIFWSYVAALAVTGGLTCFATWHNYDILKSADDLSKLQWWQWVALTAKSFFPLAAFTTFMVYFIKWSSAWARQHSDEEFVNRSRLLDIGRSAWLLEAVRDAQERKDEIPPELLKEMSRNLFAYTGSSTSDDLPHAAADVFLQGLTSLRVKAPGGTEVEAKRGKQ